MAQRERPLSPHLQVYKFQYTMVLSFTHRITGVILSVGSVLFIYWLVALSLGRDSYANAYALLSSHAARVAWSGLIVAFCYHFANGIRHLVWDCGFGLEKHQARASGWVVVVVTLLLSAIVILYTFYFARGGA